MDKLKLHWTEKSIGSFVHRISFDFVTQIQKKLEKDHVSKREFASQLNVTPGRVSQLFNDPGNLTLVSAVECARRAGMKVALVAYEDNDPENNSGPINSEIFFRCWNLQGAPRDFGELATASTTQMMFDFSSYERTSITKEFSSENVPFVGQQNNAATDTNRKWTVQ